MAEGLDTGNLDGRARLSKLALPHIRLMPEGVFKQLMFQALAERTGLELESLMRLEVPPPQPSAPASYSGRSSDPGYHPGRDQSGGAEQHRYQDGALSLGNEQYPELDVDDDEAGPRQRAPNSQQQAGYSNLAQSAIALILHQPEIARQVKAGGLTELSGDNVALLAELIDLVQRRPESNTGMLLGHWYGTPEGELLNQLAGQERLIPTAGIERQFNDIIYNLAHHLPQQSKLAQQVDKLKLTNYAEVSELEKQRLRELLQEKLQRDAERNRRDQ